MVVEFKMVINDEIIEFKSIGKINENVLSFKDMNNKQNTINVYILEEQVIINQEGITTMQNDYISGKKTEGYYKSIHNISANTCCYTKQLQIEKNKIYIEYDFFFDGEYASSNKLSIKY